MENIRKEFYFKAWIDVNDCSYKDGELDFINHYKIDALIKASNKIDAIKEFFSNNLCFNLDLKYLDFDEHLNCFNYSVLCDVDNSEVLENSTLFKEWKKGKINLYDNNIQLSIYELNLIKELNKIDKTLDK